MVVIFCFISMLMVVVFLFCMGSLVNRCGWCGIFMFSVIVIIMMMNLFVVVNVFVVSLF